MKTFSASTHQGLDIKFNATQMLGPILTAAMRNIMALTWAGVVAFIFIALSVWTAGMEINTYLGALSWGIGFVFLALALDKDGLQARCMAMTGVALLILALLQSSVSPAFMIISGMILAAWLAVWIFRRLSD